MVLLQKVLILHRFASSFTLKNLITVFHTSQHINALINIYANIKTLNLQPNFNANITDGQCSTIMGLNYVHEECNRRLNSENGCSFSSESFVF